MSHARGTSTARFRLTLASLLPGVVSVAFVVAFAETSAEPGPAAQREAARDDGIVTTQPSATQPVVRGADGGLVWHKPRVAARADERRRLVDARIAGSGPFRARVSEADVLNALRVVPRHEFVPQAQRRRAYRDTPLPIGHGQTISQPFIVALMTQLLEVERGDKVLEIGTGSGYQAAVLSELTPYVFSIEILRPLHERAGRVFEHLGYRTIEAKRADGYYGWPEEAPFDAIIVTCAAGHVPPPMWDQLKKGGRMVIPVGGVYETQRLLVLTKDEDGRRQSRNVLPVRFVPMTGKAQQP